MTVCKSCSAVFSIFKSPHMCGVCKEAFCKACCSRYLLLDNPDIKLGEEVDPHDVVHVCLECFKTESSVDHGKTYDEYGQKGAPGLVLVHGNMATRRMFCSFVRHLLAMRPNLRIFSIDVPGHGSRMDEELTMKSAVAAVKEAVNAIAAEYVDFHGGAGDADVREASRPTVFGYSMGSYITMATIGASVKWDLKPRAFVVGGGGFNMNRMGAGVGLSLFGTFMIKLKGAHSVAKSLESEYPHCPKAPIQECFYRAGGHPEIWPHSQAMLLSCHYAEALARHDVPVLFFHGSKDFSDADDAWMAAAPNGQLVIIPDGNHMVFMEKVDETCEVIAKFLDTVNGDAAAAAAAADT